MAREKKMPKCYYCGEKYIQWDVHSKESYFCTTRCAEKFATSVLHSLAPRWCPTHACWERSTKDTRICPGAGFGPTPERITPELRAEVLTYLVDKKHWEQKQPMVIERIPYSMKRHLGIQKVGWNDLYDFMKSDLHLPHRLRRLEKALARVKAAIAQGIDVYQPYIEEEDDNAEPPF